MSGVVVVAETRGGKLRDATLELVDAGLELKPALGGPLSVLVVDPRPEVHVPALSIEGIDWLVLVESPQGQFEAHVSDSALGTVIEADLPSLVLLCHSVDSMGFAPAVAARLDTGFASDVVSVAGSDGFLTVCRGAFGNKLLAECSLPAGAPAIVMMRPGLRSAAPASGADVPVRRLEGDLTRAVRTEHVEFLQSPGGDIDITKAEFLLSVGRGVTEQDDLAELEELAARMGATLSVSRPLVDAGWASSARQVGQSGRTVKPKVYLALGISGAVQHLAGMRNAETIIAVNTDPEAPIFGVANFGAVADLFDVAEELKKQFG